MFDLSTVQPSAETIERNQSRVGDGDPCAVCGKKVNLERARWVHLSGSGNIYPVELTEEDVENDPAAYPEGTMYSFPVGPECSKKIPKEYLHS